MLQIWMLSTVYYRSLPGRSFFFEFLIWNIKHCFPSRRFSCVISSLTVSYSYWCSALRMNLIVMAGGLESLMAWKYWSCIMLKFLLALENQRLKTVTKEKNWNPGRTEIKIINEFSTSSKWKFINFVWNRKRT